VAQKVHKLILIIFCLFILTGISFAVNEPTYGPEYFYAIEGEVIGQAAPGVQEVYVNGQKVRLDRELGFESTISLKAGEKYITIDTRYEGLQFVKKYLVVRHPKAQKTFKLSVPKQEFQKIIQSTPVIKEEQKKQAVIKKAAPKKTYKKPAKRTYYKKYKKKPKKVYFRKKIDWLGFELVKELVPKKFYVVRKKNNKFEGYIYLSQSKYWIDINDLNLQELEDLLYPAAKSRVNNQNN